MAFVYDQFHLMRFLDFELEWSCKVKFLFQWSCININIDKIVNISGKEYHDRGLRCGIGN